MEKGNRDRVVQENDGSVRMFPVEVSVVDVAGLCSDYADMVAGR